MPPTELEQLAKRFRSNRFDTFREAANHAVTIGADGDRLLAEATALSGWRGLYATAALGESAGPFGEEALRDLISKRGPKTSDLRSAALLALAKRSGSAASEVLSQTVNDKDASAREYAILCLAAVGDARAWDAVLSRLNTMLGRQRQRQRQRRGDPSTATLATTYLARHAVDDDDRLQRVAELLRKHWDRLDEAERAWVETYWPAAHPHLEQAPLLPREAAEAMHQEVLRDPLFAGTALL
jgi:hypothetical protein